MTVTRSLIISITIGAACDPLQQPALDPDAAPTVDAGGPVGTAESNTVNTPARRWPNGVVTFQVDPSAWGSNASAMRTVIDHQMQTWEELAQVHFVESPGCTNCLTIDGNDSTCNSSIGFNATAHMHLPLVAGCTTSPSPHVVIHELGHVLGLAHEQQRCDRDQYVTFHPENATQPTGDFTISTTTDAVGPYDFRSVMHYSAFGHSANNRMVLTRNDSWGLFDEGRQEWRTGVTDRPRDLLVGDFDGDGTDDVLREHDSVWEFSRSAQANWVFRTPSYAPFASARVGRFDDDATDDVMIATGSRWQYLSGATGQLHDLRIMSNTFPGMAVVDSDGDGYSDLVRVSDLDAHVWQTSYRARSAWSNAIVNDRAMQLTDVRFGNFVGTPCTDAIRKGGGFIDIQLQVSDCLNGTWTNLTLTPAPLSALKVLDVDGDGFDEIVTVVSNNGKDEYQVFDPGTGTWSTWGTNVEDLAQVASGNFDHTRPGDELLVAGYYTDRADAPSDTDRGAVAHIYSQAVLVSDHTRSPWRFWDDNAPSANLAQYRVADFDGDGKDDLVWIFTFDGVTYVSYRPMDPSRPHADNAWHDLAATSVTAADLAIGNFYDEPGEPHRRADLFRKRGQLWEMSSGGVGPWMIIMLDPTNTPVSNMAFADFDGDGITDILRTGSGAWQISWGGKTQWQPFSANTNAIGTVRFGDFTGDGRADAVRSDGTFWWISPGGTGAWTHLRQDSSDIRTFRFGHIDDDAKLDVFRVNGTQWEYSSGGATVWLNHTPQHTNLPASSLPATALAIGHFANPTGPDDIIGSIAPFVLDDLNGW